MNTLKHHSQLQTQHTDQHFFVATGFHGLHVIIGTSQKVTGSIPDGVIENFHWHNPSGCTMALGLTQPLTEMSTRNISWGVKAAGAQGWQPYHLRVPIFLKSGSLNLLETSGSVRACNGIALSLPLTLSRVERKIITDVSEKVGNSASYPRRL